MVEVGAYMIGVPFLKVTSTSICLCIQTSRATFTSLHTLHIKPKPPEIIDQSPPSSSPSPAQTFSTAPTSPNFNDKMAAPSVTPSSNHTQEYSISGSRNVATSSPQRRWSQSLHPHLGHLACAEPSCDSYTTGHEVMKIDPIWDYATLGEKIKHWVKTVQNGDSKVRSYLRQCVWTDDHKIVSLKVNWNGLAGNGWSDNGETIITEKNYGTVLAMMVKRNAIDNLVVITSL
ncbi:hypothetical protein ONS95_003637 [Cadophora gregata]|uniref:uncharacterized protein n=1 Tax=Cadophora gregata TaxID=51156 RepID=UPI0026DCB8B3|nr:uncharacterized protein ONS95_003637 [Cadophora gregata]KAK0106920.1 hypothetical protein ONS95_003637 [Cadophora gregata]KAK0116608.1 hypothetical protein ONS96_012465 [Cadophora gregata f. sp. sojae]